jgi:hypothetical protein
MMNNTYEGKFNNEDPKWVVYKNGEEFTADKSLKVLNSSPDGFAWGYYGSGPAQLAFAILLEETMEDVALHLYQDFKNQIISGFEMELPFKIDSDTIQKWILTAEI